MSEKILIKVPIQKTYFTTFLNSLVSIHFFNTTEFTIESLKNLLFPPEHPDKEFNELVTFIKIAFDELIRLNKDKETIEKELNMSYNFNEEVLTNIETVINNKRIDILNGLNGKFNNGENYKNLHWSIKSILSASREEYFTERYADLEFSYTQVK